MSDSEKRPAWHTWPDELEMIQILPCGKLELVGLEGYSGEAHGDMLRGVGSFLKDLHRVQQTVKYEKRIEELEAALAAKEIEA